MNRVKHSLPQGSEAWHQLRANHFCASEAPAAMGASKYTTRSELLRQKATGITPEVDAPTQRRFDAGHAAEAAARSVVEELLGEELAAITCTAEHDGMALLASLDGLTMMEDLAWENKLLNADLKRQVLANELEPHYFWQLEHQLLVSGAQKVYFTTSDGTPEGTFGTYYESRPERRAALIAGWRQFAADLVTYVPSTVTAAPVAKPVATLPVVFDMRVEGKLIACNLEQYKPAALAYIAAINTTLTTDQDFADATADAKFCRESAAKLKLAIEQALGQMGDVNAAISTVREIAAAFDAKGLALEKQVKTETDARREAIVLGGAAALQAHTKALNQRIGQQLLPLVKADFAGAIKGKRNLDSMQNAVDTELARAKIAANELADRIQLNLAKLNERADLAFLFPDVAQIVLKQADDLQALVTSRITAHEAKEADRLEAERARIRAEEEAKAQREAAQKVAAEQAAARAISQAAAPAPTSAPAPKQATARVAAVSEPVSPPAMQSDTGERINLGQINASIAPLSITAAGLSELGFEHVATERASKLYAASQLHLMRTAMAKHLLRAEVPA